MMPILAILAIVIAIYSLTIPGALQGLKYYILPDFSQFSVSTVLGAMGQMFYSMSLAMGITITYGSYMPKENLLEHSVTQIEIFDTLFAFFAGLMIIPAVIAFNGGDPSQVNSGPSLMFISLPMVFDSMKFGTVIGAVFFLLVLFAALTSSTRIATSRTGAIQRIMTRCSFSRWNEPAPDLTSSATTLVPTTWPISTQVSTATIGMSTEFEIKSKKSRNCMPMIFTAPSGP